MEPQEGSVESQAAWPPGMSEKTTKKASSRKPRSAREDLRRNIDSTTRKRVRTGLPQCSGGGQRPWSSIPMSRRFFGRRNPSTARFAPSSRPCLAVSSEADEKADSGHNGPAQTGRSVRPVEDREQ
jgi:hypothetical protein